MKTRIVILVFLLALLGWLLFQGCPLKEPSIPTEVERPAGKVVSVHGDAHLLKQGEKPPQKLRKDDPLFEGDIVTTGPSGALQILLEDKTVLELRSDSRMEITESAIDETDASSVMVFLGRLVARVNPVKSKDPFSVGAPTLVAGVRGTEFEVGVAEDQTGQVAVYEGEVGVEAEGEEVVLRPGQETEIEFLEKPKPPRIFKEKEEVHWREWMSSRRRKLLKNFPELSSRMEQKAGELKSSRESERDLIDKRLQRMEALGRQLEEALARGDTAKAKQLKDQIAGLSIEHRRSIQKLKRVNSRLQASQWHSERLLEKSKKMKKQLGRDYGPVSDSLKRILKSGEKLKKEKREDRIWLNKHRKKTKDLFQRIEGSKGSGAKLRHSKRRRNVHEEKMKRPRPKPTAFSNKPDQGRVRRNFHGAPSGQSRKQGQRGRRLHRPQLEGEKGSQKTEHKARLNNTGENKENLIQKQLQDRRSGKRLAPRPRRGPLEHLKRDRGKKQAGPKENVKGGKTQEIRSKAGNESLKKKLIPNGDRTNNRKDGRKTSRLNRLTNTCTAAIGNSYTIQLPMHSTLSWTRGGWG